MTLIARIKVEPCRDMQGFYIKLILEALIK